MRITSITPMKNEAPFILEWLVYHRLIGFNDPLVFTNDCTDGTDAMLDRLDDMGLVRHMPNPSTSVGSTNHHWSVMRYINTMSRVRRSDFYMSFDVDEFLCINVGDGTLAALIDKMGTADVFSVNQLSFGVNGQVAFDPADTLLMERCTRSTARDDAPYPKPKPRGVKSLVRKGTPMKWIGNHAPEFEKDDLDKVTFLNGDGQVLPKSFYKGRFKFTMGDGTGYGWAQLNHYALRSMENFLMKTDRGDANHADIPLELKYFKQYDDNDVADTRILRFAADVRTGVAELMKDPELRRLHEGSVQFHKARIAELAATHAGSTLLRRIQKYHGRVWQGMPVSDATQAA